MFEHNSTGTISILGCAGFFGKRNFFIPFLVGDKAYIKKKARLGKLEPIIIKKIIIKPEENKYRTAPFPMYCDTFNRIWEESELISEETAKDIALIYWKNISEEGRILFEIGQNCLPLD